MGDLYGEDMKGAKRRSFVRSLSQLLEAEGTPMVRIPHISGREIDLHKLYDLVTRLGGWEAVSDRDEWKLVERELRIPPRCVNSSVALKQIYLRFLGKYEKLHFVCKVKTKVDSELEHSVKRLNRISARTLHTIPDVYNQEQHCLTSIQRSFHGLSSNVFTPSKYEKIILGLMSPLPNEQDFAINVCALLSLNTRELKVELESSPKMLHYLLAHACVYTDPQLRSFFVETYQKERGYLTRYFWKEVVKHSLISPLADEVNYSSWQTSVASIDDSYSGLILHDQEFLVQRTCQIGRILRNFSFEAFNINFMANDTTFIRFVFLCIDSRFKCLSDMGWGMFQNVSYNLVLKSNLAPCALFLINEGVSSLDASEVISALKVVSILAKNDDNRDLLTEFLIKGAVDKIFAFLTVEDLVLLLHSLEVIYIISYFGEKICDVICSASRVLDVIIHFLTYKAPDLNTYRGAWDKVKLVETLVNPGECLDDEARSSQASTSSMEVQSLLHYVKIFEDRTSPPVENDVTNNRDTELNDVTLNGSLDVEDAVSQLDGNLNVVVPSPKPLGSVFGEEPEVKEEKKLPEVCMNGHSSEDSSDSFKGGGGPRFIVKTVVINGKHVNVLTPMMESLDSKLKNSEVVTNSIVYTKNLKQNCNGLVISPKVLQEASWKDSPLDVNNLKASKMKTQNNGPVDVTAEPVTLTELKPKPKLITTPKPPEPKPEPDMFLCEWRGCLRQFKTPHGVFSHIVSLHCPKTATEAKCLWGCCNFRKANYRELISHIYKEHCKNGVMISIKSKRLRNPLLNKKNEKETSSSSQADNNDNTEGLIGWSSEVEDDVTKSVRVTAAVIIRNIAKFSILGRRKLKALHEQRLLNVALSSSESSKVVAETLCYLNDD